ncbi:beta-CASP ribonuclease aCPSF1 [Ignisphaera sp. 4213-co]|uniref:Transcription termination factor FttA n=1 Tax=Ignisphaera cupida TaxID=3050454 RepID=A0ABD4Z4B1_9CREN|nr:beta-CASP ribonuclease aCPSF1 [Ignisphaera sp. 4213-co]MDK6027822.1 beta-CASP ribonuclease aCPSF1 [Ignisphaera sp. 4213-co]
MSFNIDLSYIRSVIFKMMPPAAQLTRLEFEGPEIAVYVKNPQFLLEQGDIVSQIAKLIKKRIVIRTDPSIRKQGKEVIEYIKSVVPAEAGIESIELDEVLGEVVIKARNTQLVEEKANQILVYTGWRPKIIRSPPMRSRVYEEIMSGYLSESDYRLKFLRALGEAIHRDVLLAKNGSNYVRLTFLGAAQEVGRSAVLVETAESKILLDFGLNPGRGLSPNAFPRIDLIGIDPEDIDAVIVTHAHLDHAGLVPYLFKYGFNGAVYMTEATRDLTTLLLKDFLEVTEREGVEPPFSLRDVEKMLLHTVALKYNVVTDIAPDIRLTLYNAGHILGSAIVHLHIGNGFHNIVYTGDLKFGKTRLLDRADYEFPRVDTIIMESTYGATDQPRREEAENELLKIVLDTYNKGGKVLIPTLSVGRAQEVMVILADAMRQGKIPKIPVYIEGMVHEVTAIHTAYPDLLSKDLGKRLRGGENPFDFETFVRLEGREPRTEIVESPQQAIIIASSGMLTGGPAVEYFKLMAPNPNNSMIFVNYQVEGTLGRRIRDGAREIAFVNEKGKVEILRVKMQVYSIEGFSGHSDRHQLLDYLRHVQPKPSRIILVHGEKNAIASLANEVEKRRKFLGIGDATVLTPNLLDSVTLAYNM